VGEENFRLADGTKNSTNTTNQRNPIAVTGKSQKNLRCGSCDRFDQDKPSTAEFGIQYLEISSVPICGIGSRYGIVSWLNQKSPLLTAMNGLLVGFFNPKRALHERFLAFYPSSSRVIEVSSGAGDDRIVSAKRRGIGAERFDSFGINSDNRILE